MAIYEVTIALLHAPSNVSMQDPLLVHTEVVLLAVKCIKQTILSCSDVPLPLQPTVHTRPNNHRIFGIRHAGQHVWQMTSHGHFMP